MNKKIPKRRFKGFSEDWKQRKLKDITEKISERNTDNHYQNVFTNSALHGIINQTDYFDRNIANSTNLTSYYVVHKNNFIYNPRISSNAPYGPINRNKLNQVGVMSPLYLVFENRLASHDFLEYYFFSSKWYRYMLKVGNTGARSDRYAIKNKDFFNMPIFIPEYNEQCKVGNILKVLNKTITLHKRKFEKLKQLQKSYLNESILSEPKCVPKRRFKGFVEPWEQYKVGKISKSFSGGTPRSSESDFYHGNIPFIRSGEINSTTTEIFITEEGLSSSSAKIVEKGNLLYAMYGATSGEVAISKITGAINQAVLAIILNENHNKMFLYYYLFNNKNRILHKYLQGGQGNLSANIIKNINVKISQNSRESIKISEFISSIDNTITLHKHKHNAIKILQKIYLQNNLGDETYA